jgi:hypothetical protein
LISALIIGFIVAGSREDADEHVPGLTKAAAFRWFLINVAKYATLFVLVVFLIALLFTALSRFP